MQDQLLYGPKPSENSVPYQKDPKPLAVQGPVSSKKLEGKQFDLKIDPKKLAAAAKK
jgi:hypothetical protein